MEEGLRTHQDHERVIRNEWDGVRAALRRLREIDPYYVRWYLSGARASLETVVRALERGEGRRHG